MSEPDENNDVEIDLTQAQPRASKASAIMALAALLGPMGGYDFGVKRARSEPGERPCINCGKAKRHNNSFCSGDCCREYRNKQRQEQ